MTIRVINFSDNIQSALSPTDVALGRHIIEDAAGTDFPSRIHLQFIGATVTDDVTGNRTVVTVDEATITEVENDGIRVGDDTLNKLNFSTGITAVIDPVDSTTTNITVDATSVSIDGTQVTDPNFIGGDNATYVVVGSDVTLNTDDTITEFENNGTRVGTDSTTKVNFSGNNITATLDSTDATTIDVSVSTSPIQFENDGLLIPNQQNVNKINFEGTLVNASVDPNDDTTIDLNISETGEINTASNIGSGQGWFAQKDDEDLQFKSIVPGNNITLDITNPDEIVVNANITPSRDVATTVFEVNPSSSFNLFRDTDPNDATTETLFNDGPIPGLQFDLEPGMAKDGNLIYMGLDNSSNTVLATDGLYSYNIISDTFTKILNNVDVTGDASTGYVPTSIYSNDADVLFFTTDGINRYVISTDTFANIISAPSGNIGAIHLLTLDNTHLWYYETSSTGTIPNRTTTYTVKTYDISTGEVTDIFSTSTDENNSNFGNVIQAHAYSDNTSLYYNNRNTSSSGITNSLIKRNIASGAESIVLTTIAGETRWGIQSNISADPSTGNLFFAVSTEDGSSLRREGLFEFNVINDTISLVTATLTDPGSSAVTNNFSSILRQDSNLTYVSARVNIGTIGSILFSFRESNLDYTNNIIFDNVSTNVDTADFVYNQSNGQLTVNREGSYTILNSFVFTSTAAFTGNNYQLGTKVNGSFITPLISDVQSGTETRNLEIPRTITAGDIINLSEFIPDAIAFQNETASLGTTSFLRLVENTQVPLPTGHDILDGTGTTFTHRNNLQFINATVTDGGETLDRTVVTLPDVPTGIPNSPANAGTEINYVLQVPASSGNAQWSTQSSVTTYSDLGTPSDGETVRGTKTNNDLPFKRIKGNGLISITGETNDVLIGTTAENNTYSDLGASSDGVTIRGTKTNSNLPFKRIKAGDGIRVTAETNDVLLTNDEPGHIIEDSTGTDLTQRTNLQFVGATVTDDSTNDRTVVTVSSGSSSVPLFSRRVLDASFTSGDSPDFSNDGVITDSIYTLNANNIVQVSEEGTYKATFSGNFNISRGSTTFVTSSVSWSVNNTEETQSRKAYSWIFDLGSGLEFGLDHFFIFDLSANDTLQLIIKENLAADGVLFGSYIIEKIR